MVATSSSAAFVWEEVASGADGPGMRSRHGLAYDRGAGATVLFGGIVWGKPVRLMADTWELRAGRWSRIPTAMGPRARHRGAMVYDARCGAVVLFGGQDGANAMLGGAWTYEAGRWRQWAAAGPQPTPRCGHSMAFDEESRQTVLFGGIERGDKELGDTWLFDVGAWRQIGGGAPPKRRYAAFAYDPDLKGCVLHGGSEDDHSKRGFGDAWLFRDETWTRLPDGLNTPARDDHGIGYHQAARRLVLLEGTQGARGVLVRDGSAWRPVETAPLHPRHQCSPLTWDDGLGGLVMHGGEVRHGGPQFDVTRVLRLAAGS